MRFVSLCGIMLGVLLGSGQVLAGTSPTAIVVGGGMAGMVAAYELQTRGWQVTLFEARPSLGGRSGLAAAEWLGSAELQPQLHRFLLQFQLKTQPAPDHVRDPAYLIDGKVFSEAELATQQPQTSTDIRRYEAELDSLTALMDDPLLPLSSNELRAFDQVSVARWLDRLNLSPTARALIEQRIRNRYDEPSRLSTLFLVQQSRAYRGRPTLQQRSARLPGGSQVLAGAFIRQLRSIRTNARVESISQSADSVTVKVSGTAYQADYAVLAVPLPALAKITLTPALNLLQARALKDINYGWRDQMLLKFGKPFWGNTRLSGELFSNQGLGMLWVEPATGGGANLLINIAGDNARLMKTFNDRQMVDQVLIRLDQYYPGARAAFKGYELRRYGTDPLAGGAYLAYGPGEISQYWRLWEQPLGRVVFAGEHTDPLYPATLEGALSSGVRAASQVIALQAGASPE